MSPTTMDNTIRTDNLGNGLFLVVRAFHYFCGEGMTGIKIEVPKGFIFDWASLPWFVMWFIPKHGKHDAAATLHDYLYATHLTTRWMADAIFRDALMASGVNIVKAWLMWAGVRVGGSGSYKSGPERQAQYKKEHG